MGIDLPLICAVIILFGVMMYVIMDGFDLGIGLLFPFAPGKSDRDVIMSSVAPSGTATRPGWRSVAPAC
jgi:cytochrome bd ubiquinol oxidase subunit II